MIVVVVVVVETVAIGDDPRAYLSGRGSPGLKVDGGVERGFKVKRGFKVERWFKVKRGFKVRVPFDVVVVVVEPRASRSQGPGVVEEEMVPGGGGGERRVVVVEGWRSRW